MYEMDSPYLKAIQQIPGKTPGEKYQALNCIAKKLINDTMDIDDNGIKNVEVKSSAELPECLVPIVSLEVAKILHQPDGILAGLKSDDALINDRALKVKWFFDGSNKDITNSQYFKNHVFPYVSLTVRIKIIRNLGKYLMLSNKQSVAEEFYNELKEQYDEKTVRPLGFACGESFFRKITSEWNESLSISELEIIYPRFPTYVIELLKNKPFKYIKFLPKLLKNHADSFVDIIKTMKGYLSIDLTNKKSEFLFKNQRSALLENAKLFIDIMSIEQITKKLTKLEFKQFYKQLFPEKYEEFSFNTFYEYLKYYPEEEKLNLMLSTFEDLYGKNLLDCDDFITPQLLRLLKPEQRIKIARRKLEKTDKSFEPSDIECAWVCYLPTDESIPIITEKISKTSDSTVRGQNLQKLMYTCSVNKDHDALLKVLEYLFMRHKNEEYYIIPRLLQRLSDDFDVKNLPKEHLIVVDKFLKYLNIKEKLKLRPEVSSVLICDLIYSQLKRNEDISEYIKLYIEINNSERLNILHDYPEYERKCLIEFITQLCMEDELDKSPSTINSMLRSMYDFNKRNAKSKIQLEKLSIRNYPTLFEAVKSIVTRKTDGSFAWEKNLVDMYLRQGENDLYLAWFDQTKTPEKIEFNDSNVIKLLQNHKNYTKIGMDILMNVKNKIKRHNLARRFLSYARWHQDLPIIFANKCLKELENKENTDVYKNLYVLAVLYDGSSYEKLFTSFIPESKILDLKDNKTKEEYTFNCSILWSLNIVNPPVSFSPILQFCEGDYVHKAINTLNNVGRRVPVDKVTSFSKTLVNKKVSVKKHGIRLFCEVASYDQIQEMMMYLWDKEKHISIRQVLYQFISKLFTDAPSSQSWSLIQKCITDVKLEDYYFDNIFEVNKVSVNFVERYVSLLLETIERMEKTDNEFVNKSQGYVTGILSYCSSLSEEFHQHILKNHFANFSRPDYSLCVSIHNYVISQYLGEANDKLESRLNFLTDLILNAVKAYWNVHFNYDPNAYPVNLWVCILIKNINCCIQQDVKVKTAKVVLDTLLTVLKPEQLGTSYLILIYIGVFDDEEKYSTDEISKKLVQLIPSLVEIYSSELMPTIVRHFKNHMKNVSLNKLDIIEKLILNDDKNILLFASTLLFESSGYDENDQYFKIIDTLKMSKHPAIVIPIIDKFNNKYPAKKINKSQEEVLSSEEETD
ncbi:uncharacterized protein LOC122854582 [Aphidius gifuensis]|uniref:uncharacterized protein LOC122854582 n=1 Tax=Aphidius gifuensis TaxID=684658 RepID=UPI001CDD23F4|nr:uncharacterized protein LOC122854582 [Aphidius gifuensis]